MTATLDTSRFAARLAAVRAALPVAVEARLPLAALGLIEESGYAQTSADEAGTVEPITLLTEVTTTGSRSSIGILQLWDWSLDPDSNHCFPAGTRITTPHGTAPIEQLRVGDLVQTRFGPRPVTRLYRHAQREPLVEVTAGGRAVRATANHPFLTQRGWISAGDLDRADEVVLLKDATNGLGAHVRLPNTSDLVAANAQVSVVSTVSCLVHSLRRVQFGKPRMSVPVVAVRLNDQRADTHVNNKMTDDNLRFKGNAKRTKNRVQFALQSARLNAPGPRVVFEDMGAGSAVHNAPSGILAEFEADSTRLTSDLHVPLTQDAGYLLAALLSVIVHQKGDLLRAPRPTRSASKSAGAVHSRSLPLTVPPDHGAGLTPRTAPAEGVASAIDTRITFEAGLQSRVDPVPAGNRAELGFAYFAATAPSLALKGSSALFAGPFHRVRTPDATYHPLYNVPVYNLAVAGVHEYVANGFVVHNCSSPDGLDCPTIAANGPYTDTFTVRPGDGTTPCGQKCHCTWEPREPIFDTTAAFGELGLGVRGDLKAAWEA